MNKLIVLCTSVAFFLFLSVNLFAQNDTILLEVVNKNLTKEVIKLSWPYSGPPPIGGDSKIDTLNAELSKICPPERVKISDNIWKCGDGKKIKTNDRRLERRLSIIWKDSKSGN